MARGITLHSLKPARSVNEKCRLVRQGLALWLHVVDHAEDRIPWGKIVAGPAEARVVSTWSIDDLLLRWVLTRGSAWLEALLCTV